jgi:hypothetical protein
VFAPPHPSLPANAGRGSWRDDLAALRSCRVARATLGLLDNADRSPARAARGGNAATQSHGAKNEADPRVGRWFYHYYVFLFFFFSFSFSSQTARQLVFCLSIVSFFHFLSFHCCYVCLLLLLPVTVVYTLCGMRVPMYIRVSRVYDVPVPSCRSNGRVGGNGVIRVVSLLVCDQTSPIPYHRRIIIKYH